MKFSARSIQILLLLLNSNDQFPAQDLANQLQLSKRTIFRELKNLDHDLIAYDLMIDSKSKKGIHIVGTLENKKKLLNDLECLDLDDPRNIEQRRNRLILELLRQTDTQKLYYYSSLLKVSEATIHGDLDVIEKWFQENKISVVRKSGLGVFLDYLEEDYRKACMRYIYQSNESPLITASELIEEDIIERVKEALRDLPNNRVSRMTENSYVEFVIYVSIMTKRILLGKQNTESKNIDLTERNIKDYQFVIELSAILSKKLHLKYNTSEITDLFIYIRGAKLQYLNSIEEVLEKEPSITHLVYEMINHYDNNMAHMLKQDQTLIKGLITHIKPTIIRLQNEIQIQNPFQKKIKSLYPDIYEKSQRAAKILENALNIKVPQEEIGLLAIHFGGAEVKLRRTHMLGRKVSIGVICPGGIGISALISSRISNVFYDKVRVSTYSYNDFISNNIEDVDIIVSTFEIVNSNLRVIKVDPMLPQEDIDAISREISFASNEAELTKTSVEIDFLKKATEIGQTALEIESIIKHFGVHTVKDTIEMKELMLYIDKTLGQSSEEHIYEDLRKREEISTQVIPEYEMVFLHAKSKGVDCSKFIVIKPDALFFQNLYFKEAKVVVVMLIPENDPRTTLAISRISIALFEDKYFLEEVKDGKTLIIKQYIETILKEYLKEQLIGL